MFWVEKLKTEYAEQLLGTDIRKPRFFWQLRADYRGCMQTAYQICVEQLDEFGHGQKLVWDSGRREIEPDDVSHLGVEYDGETLLPETTYSFTVRVWNEADVQAEGISTFETGLFDTETTDAAMGHSAAWEGATWIGGGQEDMTWYPHYLSVFRISYDLKIAEGSTRAGFVFGGNDSRLMNRYQNIYGLENGKDESYLYIETDLSGLEEGGNAMLHLYRVGYHPDDKANVPLRSLPIESLTLDNCHETHTYFLRSVYGTFDFFLDEESEEAQINKVDPNDPRPPMFRSAGINLNPIGQGGDYTCFPLICDMGIKVPAGQQAVLSHITVRNYRKPCNALYEDKSEPVMISGGTEGYMLLQDTSGSGVPMLRTEFHAEKDIVRARLYITARGVYEAYLNGERVGDDWFNPGLTQYNKTHMYQTYDVTGQIRQGENAFGVLLGEGWWSGSVSFTGSNWNYFGDRSSVMAKLVLVYSDGTKKVVVTKPDTWKLTTDGPIRFSGFFQGEVRDNRLDEKVAGWNLAGFDDSSWKAAKEVLLNEETVYLANSVFQTPFGVQKDIMNYDDCRLIGQIGPNVKTSVILTARSVSEVRPGVFLYDMGQNLAGVPRITIKNGKAGQCVTLRYGEITYPDMEEYKGLEGMLMLENIRGALAQDKVILKDGEQIIEPKFTFHGYQYVEISGIDEALPCSCVEGIAISSVPELSASYQCSNPEVNKLWSNVSWSLRDNYISIPTDCPQRNERMGWSGDLSVFSRTAVYMADSAGFLERHMCALRDTQDESGRFADIAPIGGGFGGVLWGSVGITAAWEAYQQYHDLNLLRDQYPAMKQYLSFLDTRLDPETGILDEGPLGDWLGPEYSNNEPAYLWSVYHAYDLWIVWQSALVLGEEADAAVYRSKYEERKAFCNHTFIDPDSHRTVFSSEKAMLMNRRAPMMAPASSPLPVMTESGRYLMDTQTSYAVPLALGIIADEYVEDAVRYLVEACVRENIDNDGVTRPPYSLMTGFIGTAWISQALSAYGRDAESYRLLQNGEYPSWIYSIRQGATTIWERLNSYTKDRGFGGNNSMNSFNHYSFGAVASWMCMYSLGIMRESSAPGFAHFTLQPTPDPDGVMTWAEGYCDTISGRIESRWEKIEDGYCYQISIPAGTKATVKLPGVEEADQVTESGEALTKAEGVRVLGTEDGRLNLEVGSGSYCFRV